MNKFLKGLTTDFDYTENGAIKRKTTKSDLLDMFAFGGAMRNRPEEDVILMFRKAFQENPKYALKCLFYLRDVLEGQGERRFFRVCIKDLAKTNPDAVKRNLELIPLYGRYDDLYCLVNTPLEKDVFNFFKKQLALDITSKTPSLLAKWLKSENTSSTSSRRLAKITRKHLGMTSKQYRKTLAYLRKKINVLECLMSAKKWEQIEFDKIPSVAGLKYKNAFARHDVERAKAGAQTYAKFAQDENTTVNAGALNPVNIARQILYGSGWGPSDTDRKMWDKYWANLKDYYNGREEKGIAIVDVSGSMRGLPMCAAVSMGAYIAERGSGPFQNYFITFSNNPELVKFEGIDLYDKFQRAIRANWGGATNIEAVFDLMLRTALDNEISAEDMPQTLYIFSDMEFDDCISCGEPSDSLWAHNKIKGDVNTLLEDISKKWTSHGYELPRVIFWNLDARQSNIPALGERFSYVSGFSMNMVEYILSGENGFNLMMEKLKSPRYEAIS